MAYGDATATAVGSFFDDKKTKATFDFLGGLYDIGDSYFQNRKDQQVAEDQLRLQQQLGNAQMKLAADNAAEQAQLRQRILDRAAELDKQLKGAAAKLGPRVQVSATDVANNYATFRDQIMNDYQKTINNIASKGFADQIARGMDASTQMDDRQAELARKAASELPKLDQSAFDAAIRRSQDYATSLNSQRQGVFDELANVYGSAANYEKGLITGTDMSYLNTAYGNQANTAADASQLAMDSQEYMGNALGRFKEKVAPNIGYSFGATNSYLDTSRDLKKDQALAAAGLKWDPDTQTYTK